MSQQRTLAAIMFTDIVGYTAHMGEDEQRGRELLERSRQLAKSQVAEFDGQYLEEIGDGTLSIFSSAVNAVRCALAIQAALEENTELGLRIGLHVGDVDFAGGQIHGDGVNVTARILDLAEPGGIAVSQQIYSAVRNHAGIRASSLGEKRLKNVTQPVEVYALRAVAGKDSRALALLSSLWTRRVPYILGLYLAGAWILLEFSSWLTARYALPAHLVDAVLVALVSLTPAVTLLAWYHGARGKDRWMPAERIAIPLNLLLTITLVGVVLYYPRAPDGNAPDASITVQPSPGVEATAQSIAVLPFVNMSEDQSNEYFADGMAEEILNLLARIEGLRVVARTSSFSFKGQDLDIPSIADRLGTRILLEGSVRKVGDRIRITAQLVDASGYHLWSNRYERQLDDVFAVQDDIAGNIVRALEKSLGTGLGSSARTTFPTSEPKAYELYLKARHLLWERTGKSIKESIDLFEEAIGLDGEFAEAWAGLATAQQILGGYLAEDIFQKGGLTNFGDIFKNWTEIQSALEAARRAPETANKALELDPDLAEAHALIALIESDEWNWLAADASFRKALELEPSNADAHRWYSGLLTAAGYLEEAHGHNLKAYELDPLSRVNYLNLAGSYARLGDYEPALEFAERTGDDLKILKLRREAAIAEGRFEDAAEAWEAFEAKLQFMKTPWIRPVLAAAQDPTRLPEALEAIGAGYTGDQSQAPDGHVTNPTAYYSYKILGESDRALDLAWKEVEGKSDPGIWGPLAGAMRQNPRFVSLCEQMGITQLWKNRGPPDACESAGESFVCH